VVGANKKIHPANLLTNTKFLVFFIIGLFILFIGLASAYYFIQYKNQNEVVPTTISKPTTSTKTTEPIVVPTEIVATTTPATSTLIEEGVIPDIAEKTFIEFPSILLGVGPDLDGDGLSDLSEEVFTTDPGMVDSDSDTYTDSHELYYLYNPAGFQPMRLIDSQVATEFRNPIFGFRIYYPIQWVVGNIDQTYRQTLINAPNGEYIEIHTVDLADGQTFKDWFSANATTQKLSDLEEFTTRFEEVGLRRRDGLVYYFQDDRRRLYIMLYQANGNNVVNYKTVLEVMARSFRLFNNTVAIPLQNDLEADALNEIIVSDSSSTTTEEITDTSTPNDNLNGDETSTST
jgi:hypothetical protein